MTRHRLISSTIVLAVAVGLWALLRPAPPTPEAPDTSPEREDTTRLTMAEDAPRLPASELDEPTNGPSTTGPSPLTRQRDRLRRTATRLRARRDRAERSDASETTLQALDAHLDRVEQRLDRLDAPSG